MHSKVQNKCFPGHVQIAIAASNIFVFITQNGFITDRSLVTAWKTWIVIVTQQKEGALCDTYHLPKLPN